MIMEMKASTETTRNMYLSDNLFRTLERTQQHSEQKRMMHLPQGQADRLKVVNRISRSVLTARTLQEIVASTVSHLRSFMPVDQAAVLLLNVRRNHLRLVTVSESGKTMQRKDLLPLSATRHISQRPLNKPYYHPNLANLQTRSVMEEHWHRQGVIAYANLPLRVNRRWLGSLLACTHQPQGFSIDELAVLEEVAELLAVGLNRYQLHTQLQEKNNELERILRVKQESMQDLSHELRTTLALIHGFVELLRQGALGPLTEKQQEALSVVEDRGTHMAILVERLLLVQTIGDRKHYFEPTNSATFLREIVSPWQLQALNHSITLALDLEGPLPEITVDRTLFPQVISNLLDNALKFTPPGGVITVSAWSTTDEVVIEVADTGVGIASEQLATIFERYTKGEGSSGAGIGLTLSREVVFAHGGTITAASPGEGQGTTFTIRLPHVQPS